MTDPDDIEGMSQRLELLLEDTSLSGRLAHKGLVRAGTFSWTRCAQQTVDVYKQVARDRALAW
jgi:alpha-1,3-rhamnosyl/mannosyltransferase